MAPEAEQPRPSYPESQKLDELPHGSEVVIGIYARHPGNITWHDTGERITGAMARLRDDDGTFVAAILPDTPLGEGPFPRAYPMPLGDQLQFREINGQQVEFYLTVTSRSDTQTNLD